MLSPEQIKEQLDKKWRELEAQNMLVSPGQKQQELKEAIASLAPSSPVVETEENKSNYILKPLGSRNNDWEKICEDYLKKYPNSQVKNNTLVFASRQEAMAFFTRQATSIPPREFLLSETDQNGKPTGHNVFSCGNGTLYQGTYNEIHQQLKNEKSNDPRVLEGINTISRLLDPTSSLKSRLNQNKAENPISSPQSRTPNPLNTRPKNPFDL